MYSDVLWEDVKSKSKKEIINILKNKHIISDRRIDMINLIAGIPLSIYAFFFHDNEQMEYERYCIYKMMNYCKERKQLIELLSKTLCYREPPLGSIILMPNKKTGTIIYVLKSIIETGFGFVAYHYQSVEKQIKYKNILVIRGSNFHPSGLDSISCYINDFGFHIGEEALMSSLNRINDIFRDENDFILCGHSLGGTIAQGLTCLYANHIKKLYTFCAPGIPKYLRNMFEEKKRNIKIKIQRSIFDIVHLFGGSHLGYKSKFTKTDVYLYEILGSLIDNHSYLIYLNPCEIDVKLIRKSSEVEKSSETLEYSRRILLFPIYIHLLLFRSISRLILNNRTIK